MHQTLGVLLILLACVVYAMPQQEENPPAEPGYEFVSGTVTELPPGKIVVNRAVLGKPAEIRTFQITGDTKVEGRLRTKVRVTVGFRSGEEGEPVAVRIIVRQQTPRKP